VRLEGLGQLKKKINLIGTRTCDLPICSIVPQPTMLPRVQTIVLAIFKLYDVSEVGYALDIT
jgi:hypothetical protein